MYFPLALKRTVQVNPQGTATVFNGRAQTWAQFADRVARFAAALKALGLGDGARVAILSANTDRYIEYYFAIPWAGGVPVPLNFRWSAPELTYALKDSGAAIMIVADGYTGLAAELQRELTGLKIIVSSGDGIVGEGQINYEALIAAHAGADPVVRRADDLFGIFYTGGTTGMPKGVMLSTTGLWYNVMLLIGSCGLNSNTVFLHIAPSFHLGDAAWCLAVTAAGGTHVVLPAFDPQKTIQAISGHKITCMLLVPSMLKMIMDHPDIHQADFSSLRTIVYGTAPMPEKVLEAALKKMPHVHFIQAFGQTELSPIATLLSAECHRPGSPLASKLKSVGQAVPGTEIRIIDAAGQPLPMGQTGEIAVRGPGIMLGYWNKLDQTAQTLVDGWVRMGDAGYLDDDAYLYVVDRIKDMIITGSENVYSVEVENALMSHPAVSACAVIGIPDDKWGEAVHAVVVLRPGMSADQDILIRHCREKIAAYKCPRSVAFCNALPMSAAGKVLKTDLRAPFWRGRDKLVN